MNNYRRTPSKVRSRRSYYGDDVEEIPVRDTGVLQYTPSGNNFKVRSDKLVYQNSRIAVIDKRGQPETTRQVVSPYQENKVDTSTVGYSANVPTSSSQDDQQDRKNGGGMAGFLLGLWRNQMMCDITIKVAGKEYLAHKLALAAHSDKFTSQYCERLPTSMSEVSISSSSDEAIQEVLKFIYTSELNLNADNVEGILVCAKQLGIKSAINKCKQFLLNAEPNDAFQVWLVVEKHGLIDIATKLETYITNHFLEVSKSRGYLNGNAEQIKFFLSKDNMQHIGELDIFLAAAGWIDYNRQQRLCHAVELMDCVRFNEIPPEDLVMHVESVHHIFNINECRHMLYTAFR